MDSDQIYFDDIKREVLPDGRIRYFAEKIVTEIEIPMPRSKSEIEKLYEGMAKGLMEKMARDLAVSNPYMNLLEGSARGGKPV